MRKLRLLCVHVFKFFLIISFTLMTERNKGTCAANKRFSGCAFGKVVFGSTERGNGNLTRAPLFPNTISILTLPRERPAN